MRQEFRNEPPRDFAQADSPAAMQQALALYDRNWDNNGLRRFKGLRLTGPLIESHNPGRPDEVVGRLSSASSADVEQAVRRAVQHSRSLAQYFNRSRERTSYIRRGHSCGPGEMSWRLGKLWSVGNRGGKRMRMSQRPSTFWNFMRRDWRSLALSKTVRTGTR